MKTHATGSDASANELIRVELGTVMMTRAERAYIWGAVRERHDLASNVGVHFDWADFVRLALLEGAAR